MLRPIPAQGRTQEARATDSRDLMDTSILSASPSQNAHSKDGKEASPMDRSNPQNTRKEAECSSPGKAPGTISEN